MAERLSFNTLMSNLHIRFFTWRRGEKVGTDQFGNTYYRDKKRVNGQRERRWVIYNGEPEATKVPPEWHAWLHHTHAEPITPGSPYHQPWVQPHRQNPTGTLEAYRPPGSVLKGGQRARGTGDYEPWTPS